MDQEALELDLEAISEESFSDISVDVLGLTYIGTYTERQCFLRALNTQMPAAHRVIDDPIARKFLTPRWRLLLLLLRLGSLEQYTALQLDSRWPGGVVYGAIRSRLIDEMLAARLRRRYDQLVILGAGLQTRAYRKELFPVGLRVFEVDWPEAQEEKQRRVKAAFGEPPEYLRYAACDMTGGNLIPALEFQGFDRKARTIFLWEELSFSFTKDQVEATLTSIHEGTVPGSVLIWDFMDGTVVYRERELPGSAAVLEYLRSLNMTARFGIRPGKELPYLKRRGFRHRRTYGPADYTLWLDTHPYWRALTIPQLWYISESIVE